MKSTVLSLLLCSCSLYGMAQDTKPQLTVAYQRSAISLFNELAQKDNENVCFSPLSVQIALAMLQNGAGGNTLAQLQKALGTESFTNEEIGLFNSALIEFLTSRPPYDEKSYDWDSQRTPQDIYDGLYPQCELANSLWTRPDVQLYDDFVQALQTLYDAGVDAVAFDTWEGIGKINDWASQKTHHLIPKIYAEPQSERLAVIMANALYFKGSWTIPFRVENTSKGQFLLNDNTYSMVDMMFSRERYNCALTPSFRTVTLNYGIEEKFSMTLFVPRAGSILPSLTFADWNEAMNPTNMHINLYLPRFEISGNYDLVEELKVLGVTDAFNTEADFTKMCEVNRSISSIRQMSKIEVNEEGSEAAGVTVIEMADGMDLTKPEDYQDFRVDRPFYFTIQSQKDHAILFVGRVSKLIGPQGLVNAIPDLPDSQIVNGESFDLSGRHLSTPPAKGVYIKDGKKIVVR